MNQKIIKLLRGIGKETADSFFPKNCFGCGDEGFYLCEKCAVSLAFCNAQFCPFCGKREDLFRVCEKCCDKTDIEKVFSVLSYANPLTRVCVKKIKYGYLADAADDLELIWMRFFSKYAKLIGRDNAVIVPVPLSGYKMAERGFNQAERLAKSVGCILRLPVRADILKKKMFCKSQTAVSDIERYVNVSGAFYARGKAPKNVIIVDDVFTTGSTAHAAASVLRRAGAENIQVITLARG